jgi:hypothetical protein
MAFVPPMTGPPAHRKQFVSGLYRELLENGIRYFFPGASLDRVSNSTDGMPSFLGAVPSGGQVEFEWMGTGYSLSFAAHLSEHERRLLRSIGMVLSARYQLLTNDALAARSFQLFRGVPEDRYVSAFLDPGPHLSAEAITTMPDRVADAIEVLRTSSMSTYENRRIATGVLIFGAQPDPCHPPPATPPGAVRYSHILTSIRSFHRLCDGLQTLALVDQQGRLAELIDINQWAEPYRDWLLPVPTSTRYTAHCRATLCGGNTCLILSPNGEIQIYSDGVPVFRFLDGRWRLVDALHRYEQWKLAIEQAELAELLFTVALNLAESRRGALFVVLDRHESVHELVSQPDLLAHQNHRQGPEPLFSKDQLHYLLRNKSVFDVPSTVLENIARIDGAVVLCPDANLLAFGAILHHRSEEEALNRTVEGGRTTAAIAASHYGTVLKISEDGLISMYREGRCLWEM